MFIYLGVHISIWSNLIVYIVAVVLEIDLCTPSEKTSHLLMMKGHCLNLGNIFQATGVFNVVSDFAILILPMPCIWRLHLPQKKRILMMAIFATGFL